MSQRNRELRSLNDVEIVVENNPEWQLEILTIELTSVGGQKRGIEISTVILSRFDNQTMAEFYQPQYKELGVRLTSELWSYPAHWINTGSTSDLQQLCKDIIAEFDTRHFEERRKWIREITEKLQKSK